MQHNDIDGKIESIRLGVGAAGVIIYGLTLQEWVAIVTIIYLLAQIVVLAPKIVANLTAWWRCVHTRIRRGRGK